MPGRSGLAAQTARRGGRASPTPPSTPTAPSRSCCRALARKHRASACSTGGARRPRQTARGCAGPRSPSLPRSASCRCMLARSGTDAADYRALGSAAQPQGKLVVVFKPATTEREMRRILQANGARVVDGPTVTDAYVLALPASQANAALDRMRAEPAVDARAAALRRKPAMKAIVVAGAARSVRGAARPGRPRCFHASHRGPVRGSAAPDFGDAAHAAAALPSGRGLRRPLSERQRPRRPPSRGAGTGHRARPEAGGRLADAGHRHRLLRDAARRRRAARAACSTPCRATRAWPGRSRCTCTRDSTAAIRCIRCSRPPDTGAWPSCTNQAPAAMSGSRSSTAASTPPIPTWPDRCMLRENFVDSAPVPGGGARHRRRRHHRGARGQRPGHRRGRAGRAADGLARLLAGQRGRHALQQLHARQGAQLCDDEQGPHHQPEPDRARRPAAGNR